MNPSTSTLNLTTRTPIQKQQMQKLKTIWQNLFDHNDSTQFRLPVDWEAYGLTDYPLLIKKPMDLGTVQNKLNQGEYLYVEDMIDDIQLIWDNCKTYNVAGSWIYVLAEKLEKNFKKMLKNYLPLIPFAMGTTKISPSQLAPPKSKAGAKKAKQKAPQIFNEDNQQEKISYADKINFSDKIKVLSPENLGLVVEKIIQTCPTAFSEIQNDRVQILLQNIDVIAFQQLDKFVDQLQTEEAFTGNKRVKQN